MKPLIVFLGLLFTSTLAFSQSSLLGRNIFSEGSFDIFGESRLLPIGWNLPDKHDRPWQAGFRAEIVRGESGTRELRIVSPDSTGFTGANARLTLPENIERLRVSYRILAKNIEIGEENPGGNGAGVFLRFLDESGKPLPALGWVAGMIVATNTEWSEREQIYSVPAAAKELTIEVIFRNATGEIRVDDIEVVPVSMSE